MQPTPFDTRAARHVRRALATGLGSIALTCIASFTLTAQDPVPGVPQFQNAVVLGGDWLQANALPLNRTAMMSIGADISWRRENWAFNGGWIRIARNLSTIQGGTLSVGRILRTGPVSFLPTLSAFGGQAMVSYDSTGYSFVSGTTTGHVPRYSYSDGFSVGGGAGLTIEAPIFSLVGVRVGASEWFFSGSPVAKERARTVVAAGLTLRVW
jgi:hypothetical protein